MSQDPWRPVVVGQEADRARAEAYGWRLGRRAGAAVCLGLACGALATWFGVQLALHEPMDEGNRHSLSVPLAIAQAPGATRPEAWMGTQAAIRRAVGAEAPYAGEGVAYLDAQGRVLVAKGEDPNWVGHWPEGASNQGLWRVLRLPLASGLGELRAVHWRAPVDRALHWTGLALAFAVPLGLLVALALGRRVAVAAARPYAEALSRERRVVRDLGHELRTPLAVIRAHAELALRGRPEEAPKALGTIADQAQHLADFAEQLLGLSRLEAGQSGPTQRLALGELVEAQLEALAPLAEAQGQAFEAEGLEAMAWVRADAAMLVRAVGNLLDNALRHGAKPGPISVRLQQEGHDVCLRVANGGPTIPPEELAHLGERFFRPEASRRDQPQGSGLGLAFVAEVAKASGGGLRLQAAPGGGLVVQLRLPLAAEGAVAQAP